MAASPSIVLIILAISFATCTDDPVAGLDTGVPTSDANPADVRFQDGAHTVACTSNDMCEGMCREGECVAASCDDGVLNGEETDTDCGGPDCAGCSAEERCEPDSDCKSSICTDATTCAAPTCDDEVTNGSETDVDCGGSDCSACESGDDCSEDGDCASRNCVKGTCRKATCTDGIKNGNEASIDCGGDDSQCSPCPNRESCETNDDCRSEYCGQGTCQAATCSNGNQDGKETDVDCGGPDCAGCGTGEMCQNNSDCKIGTCSPGGTCKNPSCTDGVKNGSETHVDCGGSSCSGCAVGETCLQDSDCQSGLVCDSSGTCASVNSRSIAFDGSSSYGTISDSPSMSVTDQLTLEAWVKPTSSSGHRDILGQHNGSYRVRLTDGGSGAGRVWLLLRYSDGSFTTYESSSTVSLNTWTHIAVTFDSSTGAINFYIDGSLDKSTTGSSMLIQDPSWDFDLGYYSPTSGEYFAGKIDELRLWNVVRSKSQINNNMKTQLSGSNSDLSAYWNGESQPATVLIDQSSNSNDASITNVSFKSDTPF